MKTLVRLIGISIVAAVLAAAGTLASAGAQEIDIDQNLAGMEGVGDMARAMQQIEFPVASEEAAPAAAPIEPPTASPDAQPAAADGVTGPSQAPLQLPSAGTGTEEAPGMTLAAILLGIAGVALFGAGLTAQRVRTRN
ncbi:MAG: hypothetical protein WEC75_01470 [Dehalococcoidia bacterium]